MSAFSGFLQTDYIFLRVSSSLLVLLGLTGTLVGLFFYGFSWNLGAHHVIPIFGGLEVFQSDLALVNFSLALLILGIGLKLFNVFGYITSVVLLSLLTIVFSWLARILFSQLDMYLAHAASGSFDPIRYPLIESVILDGMLALFCFVAIIYLLSSPVRKLYFNLSPDSLSLPK